ncbi:acyl-CoA dehydrogenase family protein [Nocardia lijiangensis]|uniref:acyl-CoA dehydrogenase family protein n=1 Tax=Nocardia lijiangensis TaxID=299618 RepID=UPI00082EB0D0|nr:acyl-CoA dehydrogenase family protein [Nocardia lijiangensis]
MTHVVFNQVPPLTGHNPADDPALLEGLHRDGGGEAEAEVREVGAMAASEQVQAWARQANAHRPVLRTHDRYGHRIDEVEFDPAWHEVMARAVGYGLHGSAWDDDRPYAHLARAAKLYVWPTEAGHICPISMTYASVAALRQSPALASSYEPLLVSRSYDFGLRPPLTKTGLIAGMSMTEKQGGSDLRAVTTCAVPQADGSYLVTGHKWFTSAPMSDIFLLLAQAPGGLSCFLLPRVLPDGTRNRMHLQRLKDKLGNHSNASAEVEYDAATAWLVGEEGRGVPTILQMVNLTRLDCVIGAASGMRAGLTRAIHHTAHRRAFGRQLIDQPLMRNVLADLAVEAEAATTLMTRLAAATDRAKNGDEAEDHFQRLTLAVAKYWLCKRWPTHIAEALECLGGNGYVEESGMPMLYREAPVLSIWEGSGNVAALDVLRAMAKQPETVAAFLAEVDKAAGADRNLDAAADRLRTELGALLTADDLDLVQAGARRLVETMALTLQGSLLVRHGHPAVADAFCATRLHRDWGSAYGTLPTALDTTPIIERALPKVI